MEERARWPIAVVATIALLVVTGLIGYGLLPATVPTLIATPLPRAGITFDTAGTVTGPAPPIRGARRGGTVHALRTAPFATDLTRPVPDGDRSALSLLFRTLTGYRRTADGLELVGDLATSTGQVSADGLAWTYRLRPGVRFEDGSAVTSADVARGIDRSGVLGPASASVRTPDATTVVIELATTDPQLPLRLSRVETTPRPESPPVMATGPYRRTSLSELWRSLELSRNPNWDPASDPIRHGYPDAIVLDVAASSQVADRVAASLASPDPSDPSATLVSDAVPPRVASHARRVVGPTGVGVYVLINTARVTDLSVRRSLNYAIDRGGAADSLVDSAFVPMTTMLPALLRGPHVFDAYPSGLHGNLDRARRLLAGHFIPDLVLCADPAQVPADLVDVLTRSFAGAGFKVRVTTISLAEYRPSTTVCDLLPVEYAPRYPDGDQVLGALFGTLDYNNLRDASVTDRLHTLADVSDRVLAAPAYVALDERIMRDLAPAVPVVERMAQAVIGPLIATAQTDPVTGTLDLDSVSVATP